MIAVVLKPIITEKSMRLASIGTYMFDISSSANKPLVAKAVKEQFKVDATQVRIAVLKGKAKRVKGINGKRRDTKRAYVTLKKGQAIKEFEISAEEQK